jgi:DNA segregation ATPase FtsK/SpoIIIE, S-DNA-T family
MRAGGGGAPTGDGRMNERLKKLLRECVFFLLLPVALFLLIAFLSYHGSDEGWSHASGAGRVRNFGGTWGAWIADLWFYLFGVMAYLFPLALGIWAWRVLRGIQDEPGHELDIFVRGAGLVVLLVAGCALAALHGAASPYPAGSGGVVGAVLGKWVASGLGRMGGTIVLLALAGIGLTLATGEEACDPHATQDRRAGAEDPDQRTGRA